MARREVIEINCDRCGKVETQNKSEVRQGEEPEFTAKMGDVVVSFEDLCRRCRESVKNYFDRLRRAKTDEETKGNGTPLKLPNGSKHSSLES